MTAECKIQRCTINMYNSSLSTLPLSCGREQSSAHARPPTRQPASVGLAEDCMARVLEYSSRGTLATSSTTLQTFLSSSSAGNLERWWYLAENDRPSSPSHPTWLTSAAAEKTPPRRQRPLSVLSPEKKYVSPSGAGGVLAKARHNTSWCWLGKAELDKTKHTKTNIY